MNTEEQHIADLKAKDDTIANLNATISIDETTIKTQQAKIDAFPVQLQALQDQLNTLQPQVDQGKRVQELLDQAEIDKKNLQEMNKTLTNSIAQYKTTSYKGVRAKVLINELLIRFINKFSLK